MAAQYNELIVSFRFFSNIATDVAELVRLAEKGKRKFEAEAGRQWKPNLCELDPETAETLHRAFHPYTNPEISNALPKPRHFQLTDSVLAYATILTAPETPPGLTSHGTRSCKVFK